MTATRTAYITCVLCEASCGLEVTLEPMPADPGAPGTHPERITSLRGHAGDPLSRGHICPKGVALQDLHTDPDRLRRPLLRREPGDPAYTGNGGTQWVELEWDEAITLAATRLHALQAEHGNDAVGIYLGNPNVHSLGAMTHGAHLARTLRTRNTFSATSVDQLPHHLVSWALYGHQFLLPVPDIDRTDLLVLVGHNPMASNGSMWTVPDFPGRRRELRARGGRLVVLDPRRTETAAIADEHHFVRPGSDAFVLLALVREVLERGARPAAYVDGVEAVRAAVAPFSPEVAEQRSGMPSAAIRSLAADLVAARAAAVHGRMGVSVQAEGVVCQWAIQVLNILTGNLDREGGTMFTTPAIDLVARGLLGRGARGRWASRVRTLPEFGGELPVSVLAEEIVTPGDGQIRGLVTVAGNPVASTPGGQGLDAALAGLEFMVAIDVYVNETTRHADLILPPTGPLERDHYDLIFHTLAVRNTARFAPALLEPAPGSRHDWQIVRNLCLAIYRARGRRPAPSLAARLRLSPRRTVDLLLRTRELEGRRPSLRDAVRVVRGGLTVAQLAQTPGGVDLGPLRPVLPERLRTRDRRIDLAVDFVLERVQALAVSVASDDPSARVDNGERGELLLIGRRHQRDNNSWMHNAARLTSGRARHRLLVHPDDLAERGLVGGERVHVSSAAGSVEVECESSTDVMRGVVSLPHGYGHGGRPGVQLRHATTLPGASINDLTDPSRVESISGNGILNGVPVTLSRAGASESA